jgi:hypothetical protein
MNLDLDCAQKVKLFFKEPITSRIKSSLGILRFSRRHGFCSFLISHLPTIMIKFIGLSFLSAFWAMLCSAQETPMGTNLNVQSLPTRNPLLTDFSYFVKNPNSVELFWKSEKHQEGDYFVIERSSDGMHYETVSVQQIPDTSTAFTHQDNPPNSGNDFYRIKYISKSGNSFYSEPLQVNLVSDIDFKFYPNPADKLLIIRSGHDVQVDIMDQAGVLQLSKQVPAGLQVVNVSTLAKGQYILKVTDTQTNKVASEELVKN